MKPCGDDLFGRLAGRKRHKVGAKGQVQPQVAASEALGGNWRAPCARSVRTTRVCLFAKYLKAVFSLYITLQVSIRIVAGSVCMVFSRYAIAEYFSSQFVDRKAPSNIVQEYCYGIAVRMFYLVGGFMRQGG